MCFLGFREKAAFLSNYLISFLALPEAVPVHSRLPPPPPLSNSFPGSSRVSLSDLFSRFSQASLFSLYCPYLGFCCACSQWKAFPLVCSPSPVNGAEQSRLLPGVTGKRLSWLCHAPSDCETILAYLVQHNQMSGSLLFH